MEVLGATSSIFAVVSLALQLSSNIQGLIEFWDSVREAPEEIVQLKAQLAALGGLLRCIEVDTQDASNNCEANLGMQCLQVCNTSILKLERVSRELNKGLNGNGVRRRWTCLRKALRERELASFWSEIERAKSMLIIYQGWKNGQRQDSLLMIMKKSGPIIGGRSSIQHSEQNLPEFNTRSTSISRYGFTKASIGAAVYEIHLAFGLIRLRVFSHTVKPKGSFLVRGPIVRRTRHRQITASFIPGYLLPYVLQWTFSASFSRKITFATFNLRPDWSPIFEFCITGDIVGVQRLIEDGLASPNDVDSEGLTPLHHAAARHNADLCRLLIILGAATNTVSCRLETPLLLAMDDKARSWLFTPRWSGQQIEFRNECSQIDTVRILVEIGDNDPMDVDDMGYSPLLLAAGSPTDKSLGWLLSQDVFELNLRYKTPTGHTAAAYVSLRDGLTTNLIAPFIRSGIDPNSPCADFWYTRYRYRLNGPSMLQYATWIWYDRLLGAKKREQMPALPRATMQTLLDNGANIHAQSLSGHTILDGLLLNITKFDGYPRPRSLLDHCMSIWIHLLQDLGFDIEKYINRECDLHRGISHDLGLGFSMELRFNADGAPWGPWVWSVFQGPEERGKGEFMEDPTKCAIWGKWQLAYAIPEKPPPRRPAKLYKGTTEVVVLKGSIAPSIDLLEMAQTEPPNAVSSGLYRTHTQFLAAFISRNVWMARMMAAFVARYRSEFSFYLAAIISLLGFGYFARLWITASFFLSLALFERVISS